ncbi:hypothetical protein GE061_014285 [Apolygus lucorum]|uniref:Uncharacterized protein n=1 Tax=Apolygus lucorum TaxID=248454 RepID=A0A8S9XQ65_APOLU|nr:hypothetical protein GE061_014285 [Apolygus lucorum]
MSKHSTLDLDTRLAGLLVRVRWAFGADDRHLDTRYGDEDLTLFVGLKAILRSQVSRGSSFVCPSIRATAYWPHIHNQHLPRAALHLITGGLETIRQARLHLPAANSHRFESRSDYLVWILGPVYSNRRIKGYCRSSTPNAKRTPTSNPANLGSKSRVECLLITITPRTT